MQKDHYPYPRHVLPFMTVQKLAQLHHLIGAYFQHQKGALQPLPWAMPPLRSAHLASQSTA